MTFVEKRAGPDDEGRRADRVVRKALSVCPLSAVYAALRKGLITVNGRKTEPRFKVTAGDRLEIAAPLASAYAARSTRARGPAALPDVSAGTETGERDNAALPALGETLFQNRFVKIVNKPYDVSVHGSGGMTVAECLRAECAASSSLSLSFAPAPLHRLDRKTSGVLACSLSIEGAREFSRMLREREIEKRYVAISEGTLGAAEFWQDAVSRLPAAGGRFCRVRTGAEGGKSAFTEAIPRAHGSYRGRTVSLVEFRIGTGRKHQIRAQASLHGFPLLGDTAYGGAAIREAQAHFLHAWEMRFPAGNPLGIPLRVAALLPPPFRDTLAGCFPGGDISRYI
jgi:23S rRNA pseudouridine955/2504/2580 synthase